MKNLKELEEKFGAVTFKSKKYIVTDSAVNDCTVDFAHDYNSVEVGEIYWEQWSAPAVDEDGNEYKIVWDFKLTKGEETELEDYPWDDEHIVKVREC